MECRIRIRSMSGGSASFKRNVIDVLDAIDLAFEEACSAPGNIALIELIPVEGGEPSVLGVQRGENEAF